MTRPDSTALAGDPLDLLQRTLDQVVDHVLNGIGPLPSATDLAGEYRRRIYKSDAGRVRALIRWATAKNAATGFVTGLGGLLALPVSEIPSFYHIDQQEEPTNQQVPHLEGSDVRVRILTVCIHMKTARGHPTDGFRDATS